MDNSHLLVAALDAVDDAVLAIEKTRDGTYEVAFANQPLSDLLGTDRESFPCKFISTLRPVLDWLFASEGHAIDRQHSIRIQYVVPHSAGHVVPVEIAIRDFGSLGPSNAAILLLRPIVLPADLATVRLECELDQATALAHGEIVDSQRNPEWIDRVLKTLQRTGGPCYVEVQAASHDISDAATRLFAGGVRVNDRLLTFAAAPVEDLQVNTPQNRAQDIISRLYHAQRIVGMGVWESDRVANTLFWSPEVYAIFGVEPSDFEKTPSAFLNLVHPDDREFVREILAHAFDSDEPFTFEHRIIRPDSQIRWLQEMGEPTWTPEGRRKGFVGTVLDITERKKAEAIIRKERDLAASLAATEILSKCLRLCLNAAIDVSDMDSGGIYLFDDDSGALELAWHRNLNDEFIDAVCHVAASDPRTSLIAAGQPVFIEDIPGTLGEDSVEAREGLKSIAVFPMVLDGTIVGAVNIASHCAVAPSDVRQDALATITELATSAIARAKATELQRKHERRLSLISVAIPDPLIVANDKARIVWANGAAVRLFGEECLGKSLVDIVDYDQKSVLDQLIERTFRTGQPKSQITHFDADGSSLSINCKTALFRGLTRVQAMQLPYSLKTSPILSD
jgi:PAS domain S-box-containing protein